MRVLGLALLAVLALEGQHAAAFVPVGRAPVAGKATNHQQRVGLEMSTESDVSIPYDSAARLAYEGWCADFGKPIDEARYEVFKENYSAITVMNVAAKKQARETGEENPSLLALNEYADCTADEYEAIMNGEQPSSGGNVLGQVVEAAESQSAASSALQDAADAIAEEEEVGIYSRLESSCFCIVI